MKVILAQLKKPWNETRQKEKIGHALEESGLTHLYYFGKAHASETQKPGEEVFQIHDNQVLILSLWQFFRYCQKIKPEAIIVANPALLLPAALYKCTAANRLIFDCQENFEWNFVFQRGYPTWKSLIFPALSRFFLRNLFGFADRIWLAEEIYSRQIPYLPQGKWQIFENKVPEAWTEHRFPSENKTGICRIAMTGYLSDEAGTGKALAFMEAFRRQFPDVKFSLAGQIPDAGLRNQYMRQHPEADFSLTKTWTDSQTIHRVLAGADAVLIPYRISKANEGKFPTKMFEAVYEGKPMLCQQNSPFMELACREGRGIAVDFDHPEQNDFNRILEEIRKAGKGQQGNPKWVFEGERLRKDFFGLFPQKKLPEQATDE